MPPRPPFYIGWYLIHDDAWKYAVRLMKWKGENAIFPTIESAEIVVSALLIENQDIVVIWIYDETDTRIATYKGPAARGEKLP